MTVLSARPRTVITLAAIAFLAGPIAAAARQGLVPLLMIAAVAVLFSQDLAALWRDVRNSRAVWAAAGVVAVCLVSLMWARGAPVAEGAMIARVYGVIVLGVVVAWGVGQLDSEHRRFVARAAAWGGWILAAFLLEESLTGAAVLSLVHPDEAVMPAGSVIVPVMNRAARGAAFLAPLIGVYAVLTWRVTGSRIVAAIFTVVAVVAVLRLPMEAASLAAVAAVGAGLLAWFAPRIAATLLFAAVIIYLALAPTISQRLLTLDRMGEPGTSFELTVVERVAIWQETSRRIAERPFIGHGFNAARSIAGDEAVVPGLGVAAMPIHPHNGALQIWLELGALGAALAALLVLRFGRGVAALSSRRDAALAVSIAAGAVVMIAVSFSLWSFWWLAALGFFAAFWRLVCDN